MTHTEPATEAKLLEAKQLIFKVQNVPFLIPAARKARCPTVVASGVWQKTAGIGFERFAVGCIHIAQVRIACRPPRLVFGKIVLSDHAIELIIVEPFDKTAAVHDSACARHDASIAIFVKMRAALQISYTDTLLNADRELPRVTRDSHFREARQILVGNSHRTIECPG